MIDINIFKKVDRITWWLPKKTPFPRFTLYFGVKRSRFHWLYKTWRSYLAYLKANFIIYMGLLKLSPSELQEINIGLGRKNGND